MTAWGTLCGLASVAGLSLLFALHGLSGVGLGVLALGGLSLWATGKARSPGLHLALIVGMAAIGALSGLPTLGLVLIVVLALMGHEFAQSAARYQGVSEVDPNLFALQRRQVLSLGLLAAGCGVAGLAWHVQVGFWWSLGLALVLLAVFASMLRHGAR